MDYFSRTSLFAGCIVLVLAAGLTKPVTKFYYAKLDTLRRSSFIQEHARPAGMRTEPPDFSAPYNKVNGITTFRGNPYRNSASVGTIPSHPRALTTKWIFSTGMDRSWAGGAGWTGQPAVVQWPDSLRQIMNIRQPYQQSGFTEVISASLDGKIYFIDLASGKSSRPPIDIQNPIKGTVSVDPRGLPLLYSGQGISNHGIFGFRIFSLINQRQLYFLNGHDAFARRSWGAFDGAALIDGPNDRLFEAGENGLLYQLDLHTRWDSVQRDITVNPVVARYRYERTGGSLQGVENSIAAWRDLLFFADNNGYLQCFSASAQRTMWITSNYDDTDATITLEEEAGVPYLYTGNEVDLQGDRGVVHLRKINGLTGMEVWERTYPCFSIRGPHPVNGGMLSTPAMGKNNSASLVVFSLSRYGSMNKGLLVALQKSSGLPAWEVPLSHYAWSSPLDLYDAEGNMFVFLADSHGQVMLMEGSTGQMLVKNKIANLFEASPVAFGNQIVIPSRPRDIFCLQVE